MSHGSSKIGHIPTQEIIEMISKGDTSVLRQTPVKRFNLVQLESLLEEHLWIRNAELYFDNKGALHAEIEERTPVARVFTTGGQSFYLDEKGFQLPVNADQIAYVPVFTGFPFSDHASTQMDSMLKAEIVAVGAYITGSEKWMREIDQIVWDSVNMRMLPAFGKFEILFGRGEKVAEKFKRLQLFYDQILSRIGSNYYRTLDLRYHKQLVAFKTDSAHLLASFLPSADSLQIRPIVTDSNRVSNDTPVVKNNKSSTIIKKDKKDPVIKVENKKPEPIKNKPKAVLPNQ
jgi:cell division protein FtsQ